MNWKFILMAFCMFTGAVLALPWLFKFCEWYARWVIAQ